MVVIIESWVATPGPIEITCREAPMFSDVGEFINLQSNRWNRDGLRSFNSSRDAFIYVGY